MKKKVYYYHDPVHDDFAATKIDTVPLPDNYKYIHHNIFYRLCETILRLIAYPIIFIILKCGYLIRYKNKKVLRAARKSGYFLYGNHTNYLLDAYNPPILGLPKRTHIIVNPDAVSIKGLGTIVQMLGAYAIPSSLKGMKCFRASIEELIKRKHVFAIYPEAHIWPYYTDIRPFGTESFHYPVDLNVPSFSLTNIYVKRRISFIKRPKVVTYIDGPFYPDMSLPKKERIQALRDDIYFAMKKRVTVNAKYEYAEYVYVDSDEKTNKKQR